MLGLGGGVFLVPLLNLALGFPLQDRRRHQPVHRHRDVELSVGRPGGYAADQPPARDGARGGDRGRKPARRSHRAFFLRGRASAAVRCRRHPDCAAAVLTRINRRNVILDPSIHPGPLGGRFFDEESGATVTYRVKRLPAALLASFAAGNVSSLLGIGGGILKVPALNTWCGVPVRAAAATSAFMIGVTATGGAIIYYGRGDLPPLLAAPAVLGVQLGSWAGFASPSGSRRGGSRLLLTVILAGRRGADVRAERQVRISNVFSPANPGSPDGDRGFEVALGRLLGIGVLAARSVLPRGS